MWPDDDVWKSCFLIDVCLWCFVSVVWVLGLAVGGGTVRVESGVMGVDARCSWQKLGGVAGVVDGSSVVTGVFPSVNQVIATVYVDDWIEVASFAKGCPSFDGIPLRYIVDFKCVLFNYITQN